MVTLKDGTTTIGTCNLVSGTCSAAASFSVPSSTTAHNITASYVGGSSYNPATTVTPLVQVVNDYAATAVLTSSLNPTFVGQSTTLTATVTAVPGQTGAPTPAGQITFKDGSSTIGNCTLSSGTCTFAAGFTPSGNHLLTAVYAGNASFSTVTSPQITQVVNQYTSQTGLTSSVNPSIINGSTTLTATVSATPGQAGSGTPAGSITFKDGSATIGTCTLVSGACTYAASFSTAGSHNLTAVYSDDISFSASISNTVVQVVDTFTSQTVLTSSVNPSLLNQSTTLTATVSATPGQPGAGTPTGSVTFMNGSATLGSCMLVSGSCTLPTSFATAGSYSLTAVYGADNSFLGSTSGPVTQVVNDFTSHTTLTSSINPSFVNQSTTLTATVAATRRSTRRRHPDRYGHLQERFRNPRHLHPNRRHLHPPN